MSLSNMIWAVSSRLEAQNWVCEVNRSFEWVSIHEEGHIGDEGSVFLQGEDAEKFISLADELYNSLGDVSLHDVYLYLADMYI